MREKFAVESFILMKIFNVFRFVEIHMVRKAVFQRLIIYLPFFPSFQLSEAVGTI